MKNNLCTQFWLKITTEKVVCQKKRVDTSSWQYCCPFVCASPLVLCPKLHHDTLRPSLLTNITSFYFRNVKWSCGDSIRMTWTKSNERWQGSRKVQLLSILRDVLSNENKDKGKCITTNGEHFERDKTDVAWFVWNKKVILLICVFLDRLRVYIWIYVKIIYN